MSVYTDEYLKPSYGVQYAWRLGSQLTSIGPQAATLTTTGSPLSASGDCFSESDFGPATTLDGSTQYLTVPQAVVAAMIAYTSGTVLMTARYNGVNQRGCVGFSGDASLNNCIAFRPSTRWFNSAGTDRISLVSYGPAGANTNVEFVTSGFHADGQWHQWGFAWDASNLYIIFDQCRVATVARTANSWPTTANAMGIGVLLTAGSPDASFPNYSDWDVQDFLICNVALTNAQLQTLAARQNGRTGAKVYWGDRAKRMFTRARAKVTPWRLIGDSNAVRATLDNGATLPYEQGYALTTDRWLNGATGGKIAGKLAGCTQFPWNGGPISGIYATLFGATAKSADPWPVSLYVYDMSEIDRTQSTPTAGFASESGYLSSGALSTGSTVGFFYDPTDADWPMDASANITFKMKRATFTTGTGTYTLNAVRVTGGTTISTNSAFNTNTGSATFTDTDSLVIGVVSGTAVRVNLGSATGPIAVGPIGIFDQNKSSGFATGSFWQFGGQDLAKFCAYWNLLATLATGESSASPFVRLQNVISTDLAMCGNTVDPTYVVQICEGQNDYTINGSSYTWNAGSKNFTADATNTNGKRIGFQQTNQAVVDCFRAAWTALGYNLASLFFCFGPYHEVGDPTDPTSSLQVYAMDNQLQRSNFGICQSDSTYQTCFAIDGPETVPYATMNAASGYEAASPAHLRLAGYRLLGTNAGTAGAAAIAANSSSPRSRDFRTRNWR